MTAWSEDATPLMSAQPPSVFSAAPVQNDCTMDALAVSTAQGQDADVKPLLESLLQSTLQVLKHQLVTQLPGEHLWIFSGIWQL